MRTETLFETPAWVTALLGDDAVCTRVIGGGTSRTTVLVEVPSHPGRVVARHDPGIGPLAGTPLTLRREADVYRAAAAAGVPVPAVLAVSEDGRSFAVEEVVGSVDRSARALDDYLRLLGCLHATGTAHVPAHHEGFDPYGRADVAMWRRIAAERIVRPAPLVHLALDLVEAHQHCPTGAAAFCHGDAGFGNYLHAGDRVAGLVDWEMAHTGDPHDDLASVAVRAMLTGVELGDYRARIGWQWEPAIGVRVDPDRYLVGIAATLVRMVISCLAALDRSRPDVDRTTQLLGLPVMEAHLVSTLARLTGDPADAVSRAASMPPDPAFLSEAEQLLAEPVPDGADAGVERRRAHLADQLAAARTNGVAPTRRRPRGGFAAIADAVAARLAVLPGSIQLAATPIPGVAR